MPEDRIVRRKSDFTHWLVCKAYPAACLLWPMQKRGHIVYLDMEVYQLTWAVVFDLDEFEAICRVAGDEGDATPLAQASAATRAQAARLVSPGCITRLRTQCAA